MSRHHSRMDRKKYAGERVVHADFPQGFAGCFPLDFTEIFPEPMPDPSGGSQPALSRLLVRT
jgi:hypothetical protein